LGSREMNEMADERLRFEQLISDLSAKFVRVSSDRVGPEIRNAITEIVRFFDFDRGEFGEFAEDSNSLLLRQSYTRAGIEPFPDEITNDLLPWYTETLRSGQVVRMERPEDLPKEATREREYVRRVGMKSSLNLPISIEGAIVCILSLESFRSYRVWTDEEVRRIQLIGEIFANALRRSRTEKKLREALSEIKQLKDQYSSDYSYLREEIRRRGDYKRIVGKSNALKHTMSRIEQIGHTDTTVLIQGETGTGKELIAHAIHDASPRRERPLVKVNCAALPANLIESELFGHEKGAFSGAVEKRKGRFEVADGATLFLDEIGELKAESQAKLLRVLEEGEFERVGSSHTTKVDVRVLAASNRDLESEVERGLFRKDLWYRLNVFPITVPPLRDRLEDVPLLVDWIVKDICRRLGRKTPKIPKKATKALQAYDWPGNVRELRNVIERAVITTRGNVLELQDLHVGQALEARPARVARSLDELERDYIIETLEKTYWKVEGPGGAARILRLHPSTLRSRMRKLGIEKPSPLS